MIRIYNKKELIDCAAMLPANMVSEALVRISAIADTDVRSMIKWRMFFDKKGIKPSIKITKEEANECVRLLNEYRSSRAGFFNEDDTRAAKAARLVKMMQVMQASA